MTRRLTFPDGRTMTLDRPRIMGILNATPDSFSDGGNWTRVDAAVRHALAMLDAGADIIDVGGESTRPGAGRVSDDEQIARTQPVIQALLRQAPQAIVSIDTTRAAVAAAALDAGAVILNDVAAGREDPDMLPLAARTRVPIVLMHMQGQPGNMQNDPCYENVLAEVTAFLLDRAGAARSAGVAAEQIVLDPGIGFGKTREHNIALLAGLSHLAGQGYPVLLGASRKRFMGSICTRPDGTVPGPKELEPATCATTALGVAAGAAIFRVHDVPGNRQAAEVAYAIRHHAGGLAAQP